MVGVNSQESSFRKREYQLETQGYVQNKGVQKFKFPVPTKVEEAEKKKFEFKDGIDAETRAQIKRDFSEVKIGSLDSADVRFRAKVGIDPSWQHSSLGPTITVDPEDPTKALIDLNKVSPQMFKGLDPTTRFYFMQLLDATDVNVERRDCKGGVQTHKEVGILSLLVGEKSTDQATESAATAFARKMWASGDADAFAKTFAAAPAHTMEMLTAPSKKRKSNPSNSTKVLTAGQIANIVGEMCESADGASGKKELSPKEAEALGDLFKTYFSHHAGKTEKEMQAAATNMLVALQETLPPDTNPEMAGIITGAMVSGMHKHIKESADSRATSKAWVGAISNTVWASSGLVALLAPPVSVIAAGVAVAAVGFNEAYQNELFRGGEETDESTAARIRGAMQSNVLQGATNMASDHPDPNKHTLSQSWCRFDGGYRGAAGTYIDHIDTMMALNGIP